MAVIEAGSPLWLPQGLGSRDSYWLFPLCGWLLLKPKEHLTLPLQLKPSPLPKENTHFKQSSLLQIPVWIVGNEGRGFPCGEIPAHS